MNRIALIDSPTVEFRPGSNARIMNPELRTAGGWSVGDQYSMFETTVSLYAPAVTSRPGAMEPLTV
jgi:hypothetical protein